MRIQSTKVRFNMEHKLAEWIAEQAEQDNVTFSEKLRQIVIEAQEKNQAAKEQA